MALIVAGVACLALVGAFAIVLVQGAQQAIDVTATPSENIAVPVAKTDDLPSVQEALSEELEPAVSPEVDEWGVPFYNAESDPALIVYPATMSADQLYVARIAIAQQFIVAQCMSDKGIDYKFKLQWERDPVDIARDRMGWLPQIGTAEFEALNGFRNSVDERGPYTWETGGCSGFAVHETGQDDAN